MKKKLSIVLLLTILLSSNSVAFAATAPALTARETAIAKAYVKAYESGSSSAIKSYVYPKSTIKVNAVPDATKIKIFSPMYTKKYDSKTRMYYILISCVIASSDGTDLTVSKGTLGVNLKTKSKTVYAYSTNTTATKLTEIQVDDLTKVQIDKIQTYLTDTYDATTASKILFGSPKVSTATFDSPVPLGSTYTYDKSFSRIGDKLSGEFSITVNKVTDLTDVELKDIGYVKGSIEEENAEYYDYRLINVTWEVKDAKIIELAKNGPDASKYKNNVYKRYIRPILAGVTDAKDSKSYLNIYTLDGFDGSFQSNMNDKFKWSTLELDSTVSFTMTGNIILPVLNYTENYLRFGKVGTNTYDEDIYFKIQ
ncbi:hypothetical protein SAMN02745136_00429 [Anaerocolumna jejuensis DSM 15929]|uniref:Uncharacterized protein n=1 Tax=Anaerocolumna jejuensis DSM 15929 TaxID=1121322 RepID=A0A1M6KEZ2_9FIRM|nr:hypothetical protein [Anaerocolumna jejuensis]SHJ57513.1 hypothetical protein SAMN02745136_00429 [Anaerocolumna jejuensis DSM 15929]